ncbi:MAG: hypothetical protein RLN88_13790 [Ekhidna sp.]|uniref:hypothetical protein n=1 Tax=Ekhidna sp. TaxID=2608089 RepID=UPI0032EBF6DE
MDRQNIDRLFREKLDHLEVTPSASSWSKVEKQIRPQKTPVIYWVAASVSIILLSWTVWPKEDVSESFKPIASEVSYPSPEQTPEFVLPEIEKEKIKEGIAPKSIKTPRKTTPQAQFASTNLEEGKGKMEEHPVMEDLQEKTMVAEVDMESPEIPKEVIEEVKKPEFRTVKITYIASSDDNKPEEAQKADSTGVLKKFIAFAEKIDPGDMLADIKTAKDNFINSGFKSKKDRNSL